MREKLKELSEILKTNPDIKERLKYQHKFIDGCFVEVEPSYHDILEYLGDEDYCLYHGGIGYLGDIIISLCPGPLSDQTDETLDEIISLCKNVGQN